MFLEKSLFKYYYLTTEVESLEEGVSLSEIKVSIAIFFITGHSSNKSFMRWEREEIPEKSIKAKHIL